MKLLSLLTLTAMFSLASCSHGKMACCSKDKAACTEASCAKACCDKDKKCADGSCTKEEKKSCCEGDTCKKKT